MSSVNIDLAADTILNVMVGQQDENEVREVVFDFSDWYTTYGSGTISLAIQRPKDEWPYEGTLTVDNSTHKATWEISDTDSAYAGVGQIQLSYTVGTARKKSVVYRFTVYKSLGALGNVITPIQIQTFIDEVTEALEDMQEELNDVKQDLAHITSSAVPSNVRQAIHDLFEAAGYADTGLTDELAVIASWASTVTAITLNQSSISISGSSTSQLVATTTPAGGAVTWSSSDTSVATVSSNGLVTGVGNGTATITATSGDVSATCTATVSGFKSLVSISAVYTQSGTVYDTDSLDDLKADLVVTGLYDDQSTETITDYTLSGTLEAGTSTITVSYGGKTTTFTVTVTEMVAINVTYTQGNLGGGNTDSNRVSGVITDGIHLDDDETMVITVESGYSIYPFGFYTTNNIETAGTKYPHSSYNNVLYAYCQSDSGFVASLPRDISGTLKANNVNLDTKTDYGWQTDPITYTFTKTGEYGYTFTGLGFTIKKNDNSDITPSVIEQVVSIQKVEASS